MEKLELTSCTLQSKSKSLQPQRTFFTDPPALADMGHTVNHRYKIRTFESGDGQGSLAPGAVVLPLERNFSLEASCLEEVERRLCEYVRHRKLAAGCVYQICPLIGNPEVIRSVAISEQAAARRVSLEIARGLSSQFRRLRYADETKPAVDHAVFQPEAVPA